MKHNRIITMSFIVWTTVTFAQSNAVKMDTKSNQVVLTTVNGSAKFYNTADLDSISFDKSTGKVDISSKKGSTDSYSAIESLAFSKASCQGTNGIVKDNGITISVAKGWQESAFIEWSLIPSALNYHVYVKGGQFKEFTRLDPQLVRNYGNYGRADAIGLMADTYTMNVVAVDSIGNETSAIGEASNLIVKNYDRSGYAHFNRTEGVGAYRNDGILKDNAVVLYVTNSNINTISCYVERGDKLKVDMVGLGNILQAMEKGLEKRPFDIRFIGEIKVMSTDAAQLMGTASCLNLKGNVFGLEQNVTFEGIGEDATLNGIGIRFNRAGSVEIRNLGILNQADDCFELTESTRMWLHNIDMYYGNQGSDQDQAKGDGSTDLKKGTTFTTFAYNHYWDSGKASLCGLSGESDGDFVTYHHNWFDHSDSRHPRVRTKTVHVYNNYYDGISKYGIGACLASSVFVEANFFRNCRYPMLISLQGNDVYAGTSTYDPADFGTFSSEAGGMIKSFANKYVDTNSTTSFWPYSATKLLTKGNYTDASSLGVDTRVHFDAFEASTRDTQVPADVKAFNGGGAYNNFDTDASRLYSYTPDLAINVPSVVVGYFGAGRMNHGDLDWSFSDADDKNSDVDISLKNMLSAYKSKLVGIFGDSLSSNPPADSTELDTTITIPPISSDSVISKSTSCTFSLAEKAPSNKVFTIVGNYSNTKGTATVDGTTYTECLKMESSTYIKFTTSKEMVLRLVFGTNDTKYTLIIDGVKMTGANAEITCTLPAGNHVLTKADSTNLFYIGLSE